MRLAGDDLVEELCSVVNVALAINSIRCASGQGEQGEYATRRVLRGSNLIG